MVNFKHHSYNDGRIKEAQVIEFLKERFGNCDKSSQEDDLYNDIDCYVNGRAISIKVQHNCAKLSNLGLETWHFVNNEWNPTGWFNKSKANWLVVWNKDGVVWAIDKAKLQAVLETNTLKYVYKTQLKEATCVAQVGIGHKVIDAENIYLDRYELVERGIGTILAVLPFPEMVEHHPKPILRKRAV